MRRAQILLKADANDPNWSDHQIAGAFDCRPQTIEEVRRRFVMEGFHVAVCGKRPEQPPRSKILDGAQEAKIIALRLGSPPEGFAQWSLRLLADKVVELEIAPAVSYEKRLGRLMLRDRAETQHSR